MAWVVINENIAPIIDWRTIPDEIDGLHSYFVEYYKACRSGEKLIGVELMTALEMYMQDVSKPQYRFTLKKAHTRIKFIETHVKHFESPFSGKPFILTLEQKAIAELLFGFEIYDEEYGEFLRRFQGLLLVIARKNGKTPYLAALTLAEWFCGEMGQKVICASNDYEQAAIVFDCINNFREESATMEKVTRKNNMGIFFGNRKQRKKAGKFTKQNKGTIKKISARASNKEGRNLKICIVDEIHEMKDDSTILPLQSSLSTQKEPLFAEITTEGMVRDGYLDERLADARKALKGEIDRPRWLILLYTQDNEKEVWQDEKTWVKSNPHLGIMKKWSYLRDEVEDAKQHASKRAFILAKEFNIKQNSAAAWLEEKDIICDATFALDDFKKSWCIVFVDLAETNDLAAVSLMFMRKNSAIKYFHTMYFVTRVKAGDGTSTESPTNPEHKNYVQWAQQGLCRIVEDTIIDDAMIVDYLMEIWDKYQIRPFKIGYDRWHAKEFVKLATQRFSHEKGFMVDVPMSYGSFNVPMRALEEDLRAKLVNYQNNEICRWNFRNTAVKFNNIGWVMPEKIKGFTGNKIDGTVTKIGCYAVLRQYKQEFLAKLGV